MSADGRTDSQSSLSSFYNIDWMTPPKGARGIMFSGSQSIRHYTPDLIHARARMFPAFSYLEVLHS